jgi:hypothetical protein
MYVIRLKKTIMIHVITNIKLQKFNSLLLFHSKNDNIMLSA